MYETYKKCIDELYGKITNMKNGIKAIDKELDSLYMEYGTRPFDRLSYPEDIIEVEKLRAIAQYIRNLDKKRDELYFTIIDMEKRIEKIKDDFKTNHICDLDPISDDDIFNDIRKNGFFKGRKI